MPSYFEKQGEKIQNEDNLRGGGELTICNQIRKFSNISNRQVY